MSNSLDDIHERDDDCDHDIIDVPKQKIKLLGTMKHTQAIGGSEMHIKDDDEEEEDEGMFFE